MTNRDVMKQVLSDASGLPNDRIEEIVDHVYAHVGRKTAIDKELSDEDAAMLIVSMRDEWPGIRQWLIAGRLLTSLEAILVERRSE